MPPTERLLTAEEFFHHPLSAGCELVAGKIVPKGRRPATDLERDQHERVTLKVEQLLDSVAAIRERSGIAAIVVSPDDDPEELQEKVLRHLAAGTRMIWVVYPKTRTVTAYRSLKDVKVLRADETLSGEDVLPGFKRKVSEILE